MKNIENFKKNRLFHFAK